MCQAVNLLLVFADIVNALPIIAPAVITIVAIVLPALSFTINLASLVASIFFVMYAVILVMVPGYDIGALCAPT